MNSPINSFCPLNTALVLTSDNFHLIFPSAPSTPPFTPFLPWWLLLETATWRHFYFVFTYVYSIPIEKGLRECRNISVKFSCFYFASHPEICTFFRYELPLFIPIFMIHFNLFRFSLSLTLFLLFPLSFIKLCRPPALTVNKQSCSGRVIGKSCYLDLSCVLSAQLEFKNLHCFCICTKLYGFLYH